MLVIGLTGGIGSGKSTVTRMFEQLGVPVIDTDILARKVVEPGSEALSEILQRFGPDYIQADGRMNRQAMRQRVFSDEQARAELEAILHPRIRKTVWDWVERQDAAYCIVVVPLLLEKDWQQYFDRILVVDVETEEQLQRTMARDGLSREEVLAIMHSQVTREQRCQAADDIISNHLQESALESRVLALHQKYLALDKGKQS